MTETEPETYTNKSGEAAKWRGVKWTGAKSRFRAYVVPATLPIRDVTLGYFSTAEEAAREHDKGLVERQIFTPANFPELMPLGWVEELKRREVARRSKLEAIDSQPVAPTPKQEIEVRMSPGTAEAIDALIKADDSIPKLGLVEIPVAETTLEPTPEPEVIEQVDTRTTKDWTEAETRGAADFVRAVSMDSEPVEDSQPGSLEDIKQQAAIIVVVIEATKRYKPDRIVAALEEILGKFKGAK